MKKMIRFTAVSLMLSIVFVCFGFVSTSADNKSRRLVRVAYQSPTEYTNMAGVGGYSGYTYEYLQEIAQYTGWDYEFVPFAGDKDTVAREMNDALERGEVDLVGSVEGFDRDTERFLYSTYNYGSSHYALAAMTSNTHISVGNVARFASVKIGVKSHAKYMPQLTAFCNVSGINAEYVTFDTTNDLLIALRKGEVELAAIKGKNLDKTLRTVSQFLISPVYFQMRKDDTDLLNRIDYAIVKISETDPYFELNMFKKYFERGSDEFIMSDDEHEFVQGTETLKIGVQNGKPPIQYEKDGTAMGITPSVIEYIKEVTGFEAECIPYNTQEELWGALEKGEIQLVAGMVYDYELARKHYVTMTYPYLTAQNMRVVRKELSGHSLIGEKLALCAEIDYHGEYQGEVVRYDTLEDCIKAVKSGEAAYTYINSFTCQYLVSKGETDDVIIVPQSGWDTQLCIGVSKELDEKVFKLIDRAVNSITDSQLQMFIFENIANESKNVTLRALIEENPLGAVLVIGIIAAVIIAVLFAAYLNKQRMMKITELQNARYTQLAELSNEYFFEYNYENDTMVLSENTANYFRAPTEQPGFLERMRGKGIKRKDISSMIEDQFEGVCDLCVDIHNDGEKRWVRLTTTHIRDKDGVVIRTMGKVQDIDEEYREKERLAHKARMDSLTGAFNAATFKEVVSELIAEDKKGVFLIIDIDYFKKINDRYGHPAGDRVLCKVAGVLHKCFRPIDIVARIGGDEFAVFMRGNVSMNVLPVVCRQLLRGVRTINVDGIDIKATLSMGGAKVREGDSYEDVYSRADKNLYTIKQGGRNGFELS